jgi:hypothetical protein
VPEQQPRFVKRMGCVAVDRIDQIPESKDWFREIKWDGYRVCVLKHGQRILLRTKSNREPSARCRHIEESLSKSRLRDCVLDVELLALDTEQRPAFQLLQQSRRNRARVVVYAFDLLNYAGHSLTRLHLSSRRAALEALAQHFPEDVRLSELLPESAPMGGLVSTLEEHGLEGIVVKRKDSIYREGKEPGTSIKHSLYKVGQFTIGGYLKRNDLYFDALIVGESYHSGLHIRSISAAIRCGPSTDLKLNLPHLSDISVSIAVVCIEYCRGRNYFVRMSACRGCQQLRHHKHGLLLPLALSLDKGSQFPGMEECSQCCQQFSILLDDEESTLCTWIGLDSVSAAIVTNLPPGFRSARICRWSLHLTVSNTTSTMPASHMPAQLNIP